MSHVIIVGAGAIGSHLLSHVVRRTDVTRVSVVDPDYYEPGNLRGQAVVPADLERPKAAVQAERALMLNPAVVARAYRQRVEALPLGWLRADVVLSCVDSRRARMVINQAAWRLGVPWINAGVDASGLLARVQVFVPREDAPCLECAWDQRDYELVEQTYPCQDAAAPAETGATSSLGALAAALQAIECEKLLDGHSAELLVGRDVLIDARHHRHFVTEFRRNGACRMPDHAPWSIVPLALDPASTSLDEVMGRAETLAGPGVRVSVAGQQWALALTCEVCGRRALAAQLTRGGLGCDAPRCAECGGVTRAAGFDLCDAIAVEDVPAKVRAMPIASLGLLPGDVLTFATPHRAMHLELTGEDGLSAASGGAA